MPSATLASRQIPEQALRFAADIAMGDNGPNAKTVPVKLSIRSGQPVAHWYWGQVVHDLAGFAVAKKRIPIDYCHNANEVLGYAGSFAVQGDTLTASGALTPFGDDDRATEVIEKSKAGVPYEASIFFDDKTMVVEEVMAGAETEVNGMAFAGPGVVIRKWTLRGIAVCPYGVDSSTEVTFSETGERRVPVSFLTLEDAMSSKAKFSDVPPATPPAAVAPAIAEPVVAAAPAVPVAATPPVEPAKDEPKKEIPVEGVPAVPAPVPPVETQLSEGQKYLAAFGNAGGVWFAEGRSFAEAQQLFAASSKAEMDALKAENATLKEALAAKRGEPSPVSFSAELPAGTPPANAAKFSHLGHNIAKAAAGIKFRK